MEQFQLLEVVYNKNLRSFGLIYIHDRASFTCENQINAPILGIP